MIHRGLAFLFRLYGDESELHFWTVAAHYLHSLSQAKSGDTVVTKEGVPKDRLNNPLDICYDVLCENAYFQVLLLLEWPSCVSLRITPLP